jgi:NADPH-dependent 2,4-dienoyl-CoA reductase/sulfur reductase-like enzyme
MAKQYVIIGGGIAGASAIEGIRAHDREGRILLLSRENHAPYRRPLLSQDLLHGREALSELSVYADSFYRDHDVELMLRRDVVEIEPAYKRVWDDRGVEYPYDELLLATGSRPRELGVEGAHREEVRYFRSLEDYLFVEARITHLQHVLVYGGERLAVEMAAGLKGRGLEVSFVYPDEYPLQRMLPREIGEAMADGIRDRGIETISNEAIVAFEPPQDGLLVARTRQGNYITTQMALIGAGTVAQTDLAEAAGLEVGVGVEVDEYARTTDPDIYAAGDIAEFPHLAIGRRVRLEDWDHALHHGRAAGANMAGARTPYTHIPCLTGRALDLEFQAVGEVDTLLQTDVVWIEPQRAGVVFYLDEDVVRGVLLWNLHGHVEWAREQLAGQDATTHDERESRVSAMVSGSAR